MPSEELIEVVYLSAATRPFSVTELRDLLGISRRNNRALRVTGLLLHAEGSFLQVLEGPASAVDALYERIAKDDRHAHVVRVFRRPVATRSFPIWMMGFEEPIAAMRAELLGFTKILAAGAGELPATASDAVRAIVAQFADGRWRQAPSPADAGRPQHP